MKTPIEVKMKYKEETANAPYELSVSASVGKWGDIIIDGDDGEELKEQVKSEGGIDFPSTEYVQWLEEKVLEGIRRG